MKCCYIVIYLLLLDFKNDPYSGGSPWGAICSRGDLAAGSDARADGCYDTKVTFDCLGLLFALIRFKELQDHAIDYVKKNDL